MNNRMKSFCGIDCGACSMGEDCAGCVDTGGRPFKSGGLCPVAACCQEKGQQRCEECGSCGLKAPLIAEFNALGIADMEEVTGLNILAGSSINLEYTLPGGQAARFWDDNQVYLVNQVCKKGSGRCYGLAADENYLLVCEYGEGGSDAEIIIFKKRSVAK